MRSRGLLRLARIALADLFDQRKAFGRLALVHVAMMAGDTLVTISLAGSLFFSLSPEEAKSKVLAYLLLTIAPFAVVSPLLGPAIDRSANGRRLLVAVSALARTLLCWTMSQHLNSLWLFPEAFVVLVSSKLYVVTRGALVPEMARTDQFEHVVGVDDAGWPGAEATDHGYAGFNAQLTLLGTVVGLLAGAVGAGVLKTVGAVTVLRLAAVVFLLASVTSFRLPRPIGGTRATPTQMSQRERDFHLLNPFGTGEVRWGLVAASTLRFAVGFSTFLLAFGLRRGHAGLGWYAAALSLSGLGSLVGLSLVTRVRERFRESTLLTLALVLTAGGATLASARSGLVSQVVLGGWLGLSTAIGQPSFDAITQRCVPPGAQGRTFARFAVRQQLLWVIGALIPVAVRLSFHVGDVLLSIVVAAVTLTYVVASRIRPSRSDL